MVSIRSGEGQDIPLVVCAHITNQQNQAPPPPHQPSNGSSTQQFLVTQMQLIQNLIATIQNIQAQQNQPPPAAPPALVDKHKEFMSHRPPTYSHTTDPLDVDDWLKTVIKKLKMTQCTNREMILYTTGYLEGLSAEWWNAYTVAHAAPNTINWQEFRDSFRVHHIPFGVIKLKQREFLALK
jgi:hypothetical protein